MSSTYEKIGVFEDPNVAAMLQGQPFFPELNFEVELGFLQADCYGRSIEIEIYGEPFGETIGYRRVPKTWNEFYTLLKQEDNDITDRSFLVSIRKDFQGTVLKDKTGKSEKDLVDMKKMIDDFVQKNL